MNADVACLLFIWYSEMLCFCELLFICQRFLLNVFVNQLPTQLDPYLTVVS